MEEKIIYKVERDFVACDVLGFCARTQEAFIKEVFALPKIPVSSTVFFMGVPAIISAKEDERIAEIFNSCTLAAVDGSPVAKMGQKNGFNCERCDGPSSMAAIFAESVKLGKTHYFYGGKDTELLENLRKNLERDYPGIKIIGMYSPPFRPLTEDEDKKICDEINGLKPDFLWVGIGAPKQEVWIYEHQYKIKNTVLLGVGAGFDFFAGKLDKAPKWISDAGIEWLYRLFKEPRRLSKRYIIGGFKFLWYRMVSKSG